MLDQENQTKIDNPTDTNHAQEANNNNDPRNCSTNGTSSANPLSEHDYCSPNKNSYQMSKMTPPINEATISTSVVSSAEYSDHKANQAASLEPSSSSPSKKIDSHQTDGFSHLEDELHMSDSSSSSSISSEESTKNLVIAQDGGVGRSLAPKDTPSVARAKLGRRPILKTDFDTSKRQQKSEPKQQVTRVRKPRSNTSVTDKSQWITGEEQMDSVLSEHLPETREKRQRKEVHDPEFSHFTSSDYSSSDAESDQESEEWDEDDPNHPWCDCNKPDDGSVMISCDVCKYWFHGRCVGVTESLNRRWQKEKREWHCSTCSESLESGVPKDKIPRRIAKKPKKTSIKRRGRPRKSATQTREPSARLSLRSAKKTNSHLDTRVSSRRSSTKSAGSESFNEFEHPDRLKELIRERKKAFFLKHRLSEQLKAEKMKELGVGRRSGSVTASLGESLDSVASATNSPNMNNLPINIKSEHKERSKPNIVLQINKKDTGSESGGQRLVTTFLKKRKHSEANDTSTSEIFTADVLKVSKKPRKDEGKSSPTTQNAKTSGKASPGLNDGQASDGQTSRSLQKLVASELAASKRKRKDSESSTSTGLQNLLGSPQMIKMLNDTLENRREKMKIDMPSDKVEKLAFEIQSQLIECYKEGSPKCINKFRSLIFNLRDVKNEVLLTNVLSGEIPPSKLVRMSHDDMASNELSRWRERENKHALELIKRDAQLAAEEVIVKKTHKGEEVISASHNEADNPASSATTNQDLPTTPTKSSSIPESSRAKSPQSGSKDDAIKSTSVDVPNDRQSVPPSKRATVKSETSSLTDPLALSDTTTDHGIHVFDMGCKICTNAQPPQDETASESSTNNGTFEKEPEEEKTQDQPKRLRVSIDTKLDPSNLSRLREPLIKPTERPPDAGEILTTMDSPNADPAQSQPQSSPNADPEGDDDQELYDPETSTMPTSDRDDFELPMAPDSFCWSGTIQMQDAGKFDALAKPISGNANFIRNKLGQTINACGRIAPDQVTAYIKKLKTTTKNQILLLQFHPLNENDKSSFDAFFDYLYTRNRCAVINSNANSQILKDFYILPIHEKSHIPDILKPINGPGLDRTVPNCLMGLLVKAKRSKSESGDATSYTPSIINQ